MARPLRNTNPEFIRQISTRVSNGQLLLRPDKALNECVGGIVAKYQQKYGIEIFAANVLGNHYHILARAPGRNLWNFEQEINREIAKRVNRLRSRKGHFWGRRYDEQIAPEPEDALEALLYITTNATKHGLVMHPKNWPGVNSYWQVLGEPDKKYNFIDYTAYRKAKLRARVTKEPIRLDEFKTEYTLRISPLPEFAELSREERRAKFETLLEERVNQIIEERGKNGQGFMGRKAIIQENPLSFPAESSSTPRPLCYTKNPEVKRRFMEWYFGWLEAYREASRLFRSGNLDVEFPPDCIRPPLLYASA